MRMPIGNEANNGPEPIYNRVGAADVHRKCDACEEEELEEPVMRKEKGVVADAPPETPPGSGDRTLAQASDLPPRPGY